MKVKTPLAVAAALGPVIVAVKVPSSAETRVREIVERNGSTVVFGKEKAEGR